MQLALICCFIFSTDEKKHMEISNVQLIFISFVNHTGNSIWREAYQFLKSNRVVITRASCQDLFYNEDKVVFINGAEKKIFTMERRNDFFLLTNTWKNNLNKHKY